MAERCFWYYQLLLKAEKLIVLLIESTDCYVVLPRHRVVSFNMGTHRNEHIRIWTIQLNQLYRPPVKCSKVTIYIY